MPPRQARGRPRRRGVAARVLERELVGQAGGRGAARAAQQSALASLDLSSHELRSLHKSGIMWLDVDPAEGRYLLSAAVSFLIVRNGFCVEEFVRTRGVPRDLALREP